MEFGKITVDVTGQNQGTALRFYRDAQQFSNKLRISVSAVAGTVRGSADILPAGGVNLVAMGCVGVGSTYAGRHSKGSLYRELLQACAVIKRKRH